MGYSDRKGSTGQPHIELGASAPAYWQELAWLECADGKARPTEPGLFPLVDGLPARVVRGRDPSAPIDANASAEAAVMRLRGYGNAIVPQVAAAFIAAAAEALGDIKQELGLPLEEAAE